MPQINRRLTVVASFVLVLVLLLMAATALASSGDYGVNTGGSTESSTDCNSDGVGNIPCTLNWSGYGLTFTGASNGWAYYSFDDFDCNVSIWLATGQSGARGSECNQYQPST